MRIKKSSLYLSDPLNKDAISFKTNDPMALTEGLFNTYPELSDNNGITPEQQGLLTSITLQSAGKNVTSSMHLDAGDGAAGVSGGKVDVADAGICECGGGGAVWN